MFMFELLLFAMMTCLCVACVVCTYIGLQYLWFESRRAFIEEGYIKDKSKKEL